MCIIPESQFSPRTTEAEQPCSRRVTLAIVRVWVSVNVTHYATASIQMSFALVLYISILTTATIVECLYHAVPSFRQQPGVALHYISYVSLWSYNVYLVVLRSLTLFTYSYHTLNGAICVFV